MHSQGQTSQSAIIIGSGVLNLNTGRSSSRGRGIGASDDLEWPYGH